MPSPDTAKGKRIVILAEPERGEKLNVGLLMELTGSDTMTARPIYSAKLRQT